MQLVIRSAAAIGAATLFALAPHNADASDTPQIATVMAGPVGDWIAADGGVPVELDDGSTLFLFGDTFTGPNDGVTFPEGWGFTNSSAIHVDGDTVTPMLNLLRPTAGGTHYWIADGTQNPDGSLWVVAHEVRVTDSWLFGFEVVDTDLFHVNDPLNVMSWRLAEKFESGWWDGRAAQFVDSDPSLVVVRDRGADETQIHDTATGGTYGINAPASDGMFIPTEHDGVWWGASFDMTANVTTVWSAPSIVGPWVEHSTVVHELVADQIMYGSQVHVIDGVLMLQWSNNLFNVEAGDSLTLLRPQYLPVADLA